MFILEINYINKYLYNPNHYKLKCYFINITDIIMNKLLYSGETNCSAIKKDGEQCRNKAYFYANGNYLCGVHSKNIENRITPKNSCFIKISLLIIFYTSNVMDLS